MAVLLAEIGLVTPPLGLNVFVVARATGRPAEQIFRAVLPYIGAMLVVLLIFLAFPEIVLFVPETMGGS